MKSGLFLERPSLHPAYLPALLSPRRVCESPPAACVHSRKDLSNLGKSTNDCASHAPDGGWLSFGRTGLCLEACPALGQRAGNHSALDRVASACSYPCLGGPSSGRAERHLLLDWQGRQDSQWGKSTAISQQACRKGGMCFIFPGLTPTSHQH